MNKIVNLLKEIVTKETPKTLYIHRKVLNAKDLVYWAKSEGFKTCLLPHDMHCTIMYSKTPVLWSTIPKSAKSVDIYSGGRSLAQFGDAAKRVAVLKITSSALQDRWRQLKALGCSYDYPTYKPHISLTYNIPEGLDISKVNVYTDEIHLGPECFRTIDSNHKIIEEEA